MAVGDGCGAAPLGLESFCQAVHGDADAVEILRQGCSEGFCVGKLEVANAEALRKGGRAAQYQRHAVALCDWHERCGEGAKGIGMQILFANEESVGPPAEEPRQIIERVADNAAPLGDVDQLHRAQPTWM